MVKSINQSKKPTVNSQQVSKSTCKSIKLHDKQTNKMKTAHGWKKLLCMNCVMRLISSGVLTANRARPPPPWDRCPPLSPLTSHPSGHPLGAPLAHWLHSSRVPRLPRLLSGLTDTIQTRPKLLQRKAARGDSATISGQRTDRQTEGRTHTPAVPCALRPPLAPFCRCASRVGPGVRLPLCWPHPLAPASNPRPIPRTYCRPRSTAHWRLTRFVFDILKFTDCRIFHTHTNTPSCGTKTELKTTQKTTNPSLIGGAVALSCGYFNNISLKL